MCEPSSPGAPMNRSGVSCSPDNCDAVLQILLWAEDITINNFIGIVYSYIRRCNETPIKISLGAQSCRIPGETRHHSIKKCKIYVAHSGGQYPVDATPDCLPVPDAAH